MPTWKKGQSGNPKGRPPRARTLSAILAHKANKKIGRLTRKEVVAELLWTFATTGEVQLGDLALQADDALEWFNAVKWIYAHLDGPGPVGEPEDREVVIRVERRSE